MPDDSPRRADPRCSPMKKPPHNPPPAGAPAAAPPASAWSGRFDEPVDALVKRYTASVAFDRRLAPFDIQGSLAHARMLRAAGVLSAKDLADIERGMAQIGADIADRKSTRLNSSH